MAPASAVAAARDGGGDAAHRGIGDGYVDAQESRDPIIECRHDAIHGAPKQARANSLVDQHEVAPTLRRITIRATQGRRIPIGGTLPNATPSVFHQRHIGRVLRSSCDDPRTKTCIVTRPRTSTGPMPSSLAG